MRYPIMTVDAAKIRNNARKAAELCRKRGISVWGVTKGLAGDPRLARVYAEAGIAGIADSRLDNLRKVRDANVPLPRLLMRIAMPSELPGLPLAADVSLQSEVSTIRALDEVCADRGVAHEVLLMIDVGDLREGFRPKELHRLGKALGNLRGGVRISGVATNFACASGVLPTPEKFRDLVLYRDAAQDALGHALPHISVGGTCCLKVIEEGGAPPEIDQLRACEGLVLGLDTAFSREIPYLERGAVVVRAEVVECREKPSVPDGLLGMQAFGEKPVFIDRGMRRRALLAIGRQDVNVDRLTPLRNDVHIVTASSDHLIVDVTEAADVAVGDVLSFSARYPAMLAAATSAYVAVDFAEGDAETAHPAYDELIDVALDDAVSPPAESDL